jgi:hypothetical protein
MLERACNLDKENWIFTFVSTNTFPNPTSSIRVSTKGSKPRNLLHVTPKTCLLFSNTLLTFIPI